MQALQCAQHSCQVTGGLRPTQLLQQAVVVVVLLLPRLLTLLLLPWRLLPAAIVRAAVAIKVMHAWEDWRHVLPCWWRLQQVGGALTALRNHCTELLLHALQLCDRTITPRSNQRTKEQVPDAGG